MEPTHIPLYSSSGELVNITNNPENIKSFRDRGYTDSYNSAPATPPPPPNYKQLYAVAGMGTENAAGQGGEYAGTEAEKKRLNEIFNIPTQSTEKVVSSTSDVRGNITVNQNNAADLYKNIDNLGGVSDAQLNAVLNEPGNELKKRADAAWLEMEAVRKSLGITTPEEESRINEAGTGAGGAFDPLIREAEGQKKQGMPKSVIAAGERGGFMNTQFAGAAALTPIEGGDFVGAGGELERIKSVYDNNISNLKGQKEQAIISAKAAAREAIRTGKKQDLDAAMSFYKFAADASNESIKLANEKITAISNWESMKQGKVKFAQEQADKTASYVAKSIYSTLGDDNEANLKAIQDAAKQYNLDPNQLIASVNDYAATQAKDSFFKGDQITKMMLDLPVGETKTITDPTTGTEFTIEGLKSPDSNYKQYTFTDDKGIGTIVNFDPTANGGKGAVVSTNELGKIGKTKAAGINVNMPKMLITDMFVGNKAVGSKLQNPYTGEVTYKNMAGQTIKYEELPSGARPGGVSFSPDEDSDTTSILGGYNAPGTQ